MKTPYNPKHFGVQKIVVLCSSHEDRCLAILNQISGLSPDAVILFHYTDPNEDRELNHHKIVDQLSTLSIRCLQIDWDTGRPSHSLGACSTTLATLIDEFPLADVVFDISVFTRRHLLMLFRWFDDLGYWDRLSVVYSEPERYEMGEYIPLSFGVSKFDQIPGYPACSDLGRPIHLMLFLGYEGDRASAIYEHIQPSRTTLGVPYPPYRPEWDGRTEFFNRDVIRMVGEECIEHIESLDPDKVQRQLGGVMQGIFGRSHNSSVISPHGTKPQTLGVYMYLRECVDPPSVIYASPLRHNHRFYSHGIGNIWRLK